MKKTLSQTQVKKQIDEFFKNIKSKSQKEIKKIKRLAMAYNILLKEKRKLFCKECYVSFDKNSKTRIKKDKKIIHCVNCDYVSRWKIK